MKKNDDDDDDEVIFVSRKRMSPVEQEMHTFRRTSFEIRKELAEMAKEKALNEAQAAKEKAQDEAEDARLNEMRKTAEAIIKFCERDGQRMEEEMQKQFKKIKKN